MDPVELTAGGLLLRPWCPQDAESVLRACQDPLIQRWAAIPVPYRPEHAREFVGRACGTAWSTGIATPLGIFDSATGELLGAHGLTALDQASGIARTGVWLAPWARHRGVAELATRAVARWALEVLPLRLLTWWVELGDHASRLIAERVGFTFGSPVAGLLPPGRGGEIRAAWHGTLRMEEIRDEAPGWLARGAPGAQRARTFAGPQPWLDASGHPLPQPPSRPEPGSPGTVLRPVTEADLDWVVNACGDPETARWTTLPVPYTRTHAVTFVRHSAPSLWASGEGAVFALVDEHDRYAGAVNLRIAGDDPETAEIGFLVAPHARGRGYATRAVTAACRWGFHSLGLHRIVWTAYVGNHASRRVAEKTGSS
jgi:RimJ/RimL family protein N-acetyltransferase